MMRFSGFDEHSFRVPGESSSGWVSSHRLHRLGFQSYLGDLVDHVTLLLLSQESVHHVDSALVFHRSSLTSLLTVKATAPPAGEQQTLSEENSEEQMTESSGGRVYMLWEGCEQLSSPALHPLTSASVILIRPPRQTSPQPPAGGLTSAEPLRSCEAPAEYVSGGEAQEEERGSSQDINLLTLTFGMQPEDQLASSSSEDVTSEPPAPTWTFCPAEEEQEEVESGYMCH